MSLRLFASDKLRIAEQSAIQADLHITKPHQKLYKPIAREFSPLSDRDALIAKAAYEFHWTHRRIGKVFKLNRSTITKIITKIKHKIGENSGGNSHSSLISRRAIKRESHIEPGETRQIKRGGG